MSKNVKVHYATVERGNESNPYDEWGPTLCGLEYTESPLTNNINEVTCKKCLKAFPKFESEMKHVAENWSDYF